MESKALKYLPWAIVVIICLLFLNHCNDAHKERFNHDKNIAFANQMIYNNEATLMRTKNDLGQEIVTQKTLYLSEKEAKEMGLIENKRLKNIKQETRIITKTIIKEVYIPITDTFTIINGDTIHSRTFKKENRWYGLYGKVLPNQILMDSMHCNSEIVATAGYEKQKIEGKMFKKSVLVLDVKDKNPNTRITGLYNVTVNPRKKMFFEKTWFKLTVGAAGGFYLRSKLK